MDAKGHPKGQKNEDETRTKFKSGFKQQHVILNDPPMKIADFPVCGDVKTALRTLKKLIHGNFPLRSPSRSDFDGEEWLGAKRDGGGGGVILSVFGSGGGYRRGNPTLTHAFRTPFRGRRILSFAVRCRFI